MTKPRLVNLVVCSEVTIRPKVNLLDVRRRWKRPTESLWLVADIDNPTEQPFTWDVQILHRRTVLDHLGETLELARTSQLIVPVLLGTADFEPKQYRLRWLLHEEAAGTIDVDFGHPEADE